MNITREHDGQSLLTTSSVDQAALYGLLKKLFALGIPLIAVQRCER